MYTKGPYTLDPQPDSDEVYIFANEAPAGQKLLAVCYGDNSAANAEIWLWI